MNNLTVIETLRQPTNSDGTLKATIAPTRLVENYIDKGRLIEHIDGTFTLDSVTYTPKQSAITASWLCDNIGKLAEAFRLAEAGFCTQKQKETADIIADRGTVKTKPLEGHVMTSAQWEQSCIDKLPPIPEPDYIGAMSLIATIKESMTKTEQWSIIQQSLELVNVRVYSIYDCPREAIEKYEELVTKENAIASAICSLSVYLDNIEPTKGYDCMLSGEFYPERGQGSEFNLLCDQEKWHIQPPKDIPAVVDKDWNIVKPAYKLMTIKVI